ncbi:MAG: phosphoglycerate mutase family protein [Betaproteobacteria bacterium]|nr:phosphoglycerate mutase family protein [Betaproteobacteria bacterium]
MALLIARHGETALNVAGIVQPADTGLSPHGLQQADALGARLAQEYRVAAIVASDLLRARQTAEQVALHVERSVDTSPDWRERNFGALRGRAYRSLDFNPITMIEAPPEGESLAQFEARVADGCARLVARVSGLTQAAADRLADAEHLLLVTHGLVVRQLLAAHIEGGAASVRAGPPANASLVVAEVIGGRLRLALGPCTAHLARLPPQARDGVIGL